MNKDSFQNDASSSGRPARPRRPKSHCETSPRLHVNADYCKGCLICVEACPKGAIAPSTSINAKGYTLPEESDMSRCTGCRLCELVCPDFAIAVETDEEQGAPLTDEIRSGLQG